MKRTHLLAIGLTAAALAACFIVFRVNFVLLGDQICPKHTDEVHSVSFETTRMSELNRCQSLTSLGAAYATEESMGALEPLPKLESLFLSLSDLGAGSMQKLSDFPALGDILFMNCKLDVTGLNPPALYRLQVLGGELYHAETLGSCPQLRLFTIESVVVDGAVTKENGVYALQDTGFLAALDQVTELWIYGYEIHDISGILEMDSLETLSINSSTLSVDDRNALERRGITVTERQEDAHAGETN